MIFEKRITEVSVDGEIFPAEVRGMDVESASINVLIKYRDNTEESVTLYTTIPENTPNEVIKFFEQEYSYVNNDGILYTARFLASGDTENTEKVERS